jgi:hypothetical protein
MVAQNSLSAYPDPGFKSAMARKVRHSTIPSEIWNLGIIRKGSFLASLGKHETLVGSNLQHVLKLDLLESSCSHVGDYPKTNADVEEGNR